MTQRLAFLIPLLLAAAGIFYAVERSAADRDLQRLIVEFSGVPDEMTKHLLHDDPDDLNAYLKKFDARALVRTGQRLGYCVDTTSVAGFVACRNRQHPLAAPVFAFLEREFDRTELNEGFKRMNALSPEDGLALAKAKAIAAHYVKDELLPAPERIAGLRRVIAFHQEHGYNWGIAHYEYVLGCLLHDEDKSGPWMAVMEGAIAKAKNEGAIAIACQALGTLGVWAATDGDYDAMGRYFDEFKQLALDFDMADQAARACYFWGAHYQSKGNLGLALANFREAERISVERNSYHSSFVSLLYLGSFYLDLGCRDLAGQAIESARDRLADLWLHNGPELALALGSVARLEMHALMQAGDVESASAGYGRILAGMPRGYGAFDSVRVYHAWCRGLMDQGEPVRALEVLADAESLLRREATSERRIRLAVVRARARFATGQTAECEAALANLEREAATGTPNPVRTWSWHDALRVRLALAAGDTTEVSRWLQIGLERLGENLDQAGASQESYLQHEASNPLRTVMEELLAGDPERDLLAYLLWRQLPRRMGSQSRGEMVDETCGEMAYQAGGLRILVDLLQASVERRPLPPQVQAAWRSYREALAAAGGQHLVYAIRGESVTRWRVDEGGVQRDRLEIDSAELNRQTESCVDAISRAPVPANAALVRPAHENLRELARNLLPGDLMATDAESGPACLYLTVEGCLSTLPFAALNTSDTAYVPLVSLRPLIYLRALTRPDAAHRKPGPGLVVAAPLIDQRLQRLLGGLQNLDKALEEAETVAERDPSARLLTGARATKQALTASWQDAEYLYFAGHVARDPQIPYRSFVPLSDTKDNALVDHVILDVHDIRAGTFDCVSLAVLSGCASGATYLTQAAGAPSLGDVFLDAGVQSTVQTFWSVSDAAGFALMGRFISEWRTNGQTPARALWRARAALASEETGQYRHPYYWASYALKQAGLSYADAGKGPGS